MQKPESKRNAKSLKGKRVRFAIDPSTVSKPSTRQHRRSSEDAKWTEDPANSAQSSLLLDKTVSHAVTTFDVNTELREGLLHGEDGIIPKELAHLENDSDDANSSSEDELIPNRKRRRGSGEDEREENLDSLNLSDAIVAVVSVLKPGQAASDVQTPEARALASSNLADRDREYLLALVSKWSLRWGESGKRIHGPFTTAEMLTWARARYFSQREREGFVRPLGGCKWSRACDVFCPDQNR